MSTNTAFHIAVLPGDGIGPEVMEPTLEILRRIEASTPSLAFRFTEGAAGAGHYKETGKSMPDSTIKLCEDADAILLGACGLPSVRYPDNTEIMAEFLQVPYSAVCFAAIIPGILFYSCLFFFVDLEAAKHKIGAAKVDDAPKFLDVLKDGWPFLLPIAFLVTALMYPEVSQLTPEKVAVVTTGLVMLLSTFFGYRGRRTTVLQMLKAISDTGRVSLDIILIGAAAGIMVGIMSISGLAFSMTIQLLALSGDNIFALLLLIAVLAFVLGIGLPTVSVYILTATLLAPALVKLGVTPMAAHMFVMYNGILSMITPPVAFAAYAAANIARTDGWTTGWLACLVGWSTFVLPFLFVLTPSLLMDGTWTEILFNFSRVMYGIYLGTAVGVGFALMRVSATDWVGGGWSPEETVVLAKELKKRGMVEPPLKIKGFQQSIYVQIRFMDAIVPSPLSPSNLGLPARREVKGFLWRTAVMASQIAGDRLW